MPMVFSPFQVFPELQLLLELTSLSYFMLPSVPLADQDIYKYSQRTYHLRLCHKIQQS